VTNKTMKAVTCGSITGIHGPETCGPIVGFPAEDRTGDHWPCGPAVAPAGAAAVSIQDRLLMEAERHAATVPPPADSPWPNGYKFGGPIDSVSGSHGPGVELNPVPMDPQIVSRVAEAMEATVARTPDKPAWAPSKTAPLTTIARVENGFSVVLGGKTYVLRTPADLAEFIEDWALGTM
jgi:hypothetical protein